MHAPATVRATAVRTSAVGALLVALGGAAGSAARWEVGELLPRDPAGFPWATLVVNLAGCALIGWCAGRLRRAELWLLLVTGGLGGFTTFSAFAVETRELVAAGRPLHAGVYVVASVGGGLTPTRLVARLGPRPTGGTPA